MLRLILFYSVQTIKIQRQFREQKSKEKSAQTQQYIKI